jgi:MFS family permease
LIVDDPFQPSISSDRQDRCLKTIFDPGMGNAEIFWHALAGRLSQTPPLTVLRSGTAQSGKRRSNGGGAMADVATGGRIDEIAEHEKRAIHGAFWGFFVDYFDILLPIVALIPALPYFIPTSLEPTTRTAIASSLIIVTFLGRPIGAIVFGYLADSIGRKKTTLIAVGGITASTFLFAFLPGFDTIGTAAPVLLVMFRFIGGIFMGGEYVGANPLALEATPKTQRGIVAAAVSAAYPSAYVALSLVTIAVLMLFPPTGEPNQYVSFGWRIPFVVGGVISFLLFMFYLRVPESETWRRAHRTSRSSALRQLFTGNNLGTFGQVFMLMTGIWFGLYMVTAATPSLLIAFLHQPSTSVTYALMIANAAMIGSYLLYGIMGQKFGRRETLAVTCVLSATVSAFSFYAGIKAVAAGSFNLGMMFVGLSMVLTTSPNAMVMAYLCERFPTSVRASGYGIAYTLAIIIPSFYPFYFAWLSNVMSYEYTPVVLLVFGGLLGTAGALLGPSTNELELDQVPS